MTEPIRYEVDLTDRLHHLVRVHVHLPHALAAGARLVLPTWTPGSYTVRNYARHVQWVTAQARDGQPVSLTPDTVSSWRLDDDTDRAVSVTFELYANELTVRTNHVDDHHALLVAAATFPYVEGATEREHVVRLEATPANHRVWSLLPPGPQPDTFVADNYDHLVDAAFEVGDHPSTTVDVGGVAHEFVWAGHGPAPDLARISDEVSAIAGAAGELMGGPVPARRCTLLCLAWDHGGGGLEHRDGAVIQVPVHTFGDDMLTARFQSLVAHEYLHLWNVKRLIPAALVRPDYEHPTHSPSLWVAEGWTAYYDELIPTRAGLWTASQLLDHLAESWRQVVTSPGIRMQSLRQASHDAWTKQYIRDENTPNVTTDYYAHGAAVAWELDLRLRAASPDGGGLDDVLRLLWQRHGGADDGYGEADVIAAFDTVGGDEVARIAERRVAEPDSPRIDDALLAAIGLRWVDKQERPIPDLGARTFEDDTGIRLAHVLRDSPAWRAGLTGGDHLLAVDGTSVSRGELASVLRRHVAGEQIELTVRRGPRLLTLPVKLGDPVPERRLARVAEPTDAQRAAFTSWCGKEIEQLG